MARRCYQRICSVAFLLVLLGSTVASVPVIGQGLGTLDILLKAHNAWAVPPASVQLIGTSSQSGGMTTPVKITATRLEEVLVESGEQKQVISPSRSFKDDGKTITYAEAPSGFNQLDVTGLFFIGQLTQRTVQVSEPKPTKFNGQTGYVFRVTSNRTQLHYGVSRVYDIVDVYADERGRLLGLSRLFYDDQPFRYTETYVFGEYRDTNDVLLPYHIEIYRKGRLTETLQVSSYEFEIPTPTTLFKPTGRVQ